MRTKLKAWRTLPREDRSHLARAWTYLFVAKAALPVLPLPQVGALLNRLPLGSARDGQALPAAHLARLVDVAARNHVRPMTCLSRSLALRTLLHRQGDEADLRIGVRREEDRLKAHAWVEQAGTPVGEPTNPTHEFVPLEHSWSRP